MLQHLPTTLTQLKLGLLWTDQNMDGMIHRGKFFRKNFFVDQKFLVRPRRMFPNRRDSETKDPYIVVFLRSNDEFMTVVEYRRIGARNFSKGGT